MNCTCGEALKQFWVWRDANGRLHASHFQPSAGLECSVFAITARDALLPLSGGGPPRHLVADARDATVTWLGRCMPHGATTPAGSEILEPTSVR